MKRRQFIEQLAIGACVLPMTAAWASARPGQSRLGLVTYCCRIRQRHAKGGAALSDPFSFLKHCRELGAGGMQIDLGVLDANVAARLREQAEEWDMFIEAIISVPKQKADLDTFTAKVKTAAAAHAQVARTTIIPGRRYEYFDSLEKFREYEARGRRALELAAPVAEKFKVALAVENHKDHRNEERVALFKHIDNEYVGACVDTGNSVSLLEDPLETAQALAPWAHSVHLKDQAVQAYDDGFLLADIPLGQGCLPLKQIVNLLRIAKPGIHLSLELITRDPLKVPTHSKEYWATFPDLPASDLARTLRMVRDGATDNLQYVSRMTKDEQLQREDMNVRESLDYARDELGI